MSIEVTLFLTSDCVILFNNVHGYLSPPTEMESTSPVVNVHKEHLMITSSTDDIHVGSLMYQLDGTKHQQFTISPSN